MTKKKRVYNLDALPRPVYKTDRKYFFWDPIKKPKRPDATVKPKRNASFEVRNHFHSGSYAMARHGGGALLEHPYNAPKREALKVLTTGFMSAPTPPDTKPVVIERTDTHTLLLVGPNNNTRHYYFIRKTSEGEQKSISYGTSRHRAIYAYEDKRIKWLKG